jgi:lycopene beta-cyclase
VTEEIKFDIIIAGAGAAGLSLLWRIKKSPSLNDQKVLVIDQSFEPANDKTWCFWEDIELPDTDLIHHEWNNITVRIGKSEYSETLERHTYKCLKSKDFSEYILNEARSNDQFTFLEADIINFSSNDEYARVHTSEGTFESKKIFQSVLKPHGFNNLKVDISLLQHFLGWEIKCNDHLFDPGIATIMDFDVPQMKGTSFIYLLPFSEKKALVEYTIFSKSPIQKNQYRREISNYLASRFNLTESKYSIEREEFGVIPMEDRRYPSQFCKFVWNVGMAGGNAKPSTGYTFSRIQRQSDGIIKSLESGKRIELKPTSSYRYRVYDIMMLYLLEFERDNALKAFEYLFRKNDFDRVFEFLSEESTLFNELAIFSKMPYMPFFRSIYNMKHRIFSGA